MPESEATNYTGVKISIITTIAVGVVIVVGSLLLNRPSTTAEDTIAAAATAEYGRQILRETASILGPEHADPEQRYSGTHMACASCHIDTGTEPGTLSLLQTSTRYPRFSGRDGGDRDLRDRINGCMQRSMNGRALPRDSIEMIAMEAYILDLGNQFAAMGQTRRSPHEPPAFQEPQRAADVDAGELVYEERCQVCHGDQGAGLKATLNLEDGYLFPPLWGPDSYNNGAGMTRVLTAGRFIKARMPLGKADLSDDQAYDVAAYINSHSRPEKSGLENDFPELSRKPVDSPYPPYADSFSQEQHRLGPFAPIREYYDSQ
jgi:thiosulfate dehydrogenase